MIAQTSQRSTRNKEFFAGLIFFRINEETGKLEFLVFDYTDYTRHRKTELRFPGGCNERGETYEGTARREAWEEVGAKHDFQVAFFGPVWGTEVNKNHHQQYFAIHNWHGEMRTKIKQEDDGTVLGPPRWVDSSVIDGRRFYWGHQNAWRRSLPRIAKHLAELAEEKPRKYGQLYANFSRTSEQDENIKHWLVVNA